MAKQTELPIVFAEDGSVVVNFGILSGREATQAELDRLALMLRRAGAGAEMTITAERRHDIVVRMLVNLKRLYVRLRGRGPPGARHSCRVAHHPPDGDDLRPMGGALR